MSDYLSPREWIASSFWPCLLLTLFTSIAVHGAEPTREELDFFENEIRPLLVKHCYECHGNDGKEEGELRLNGRAVILHGGASGPAAIPGKPKESLLIEAVQYRSLEMPPNGKLPQSEIDKLVRWVEKGMQWPEGDGEPVEKKNKTFQFTEEQLKHWAFQPIKAQTPPPVSDPAWARNPIDPFILSKLETRNVRPNDVAGRATLLRRITYDLTGLPPSIDELNQFLLDESADAWEKVIDRLLASPHYGERWGRHWLDVVRYADTAGDASDYPLPDAYKYRNYVIKSFNEDKPYDQFLREQYAGDLLAVEAPPEKFEELTTATTHLALARRFGYNDTNFHYFHLTIHDLIDTMGQSILGLSVGCARCHDHKFEPVSAKDYYALYGIFSSTKFTFPGAEEVRYPKDLVPLVSKEEAASLQAKRDAELKEIDQAIQAHQLPIVNLEGGMESKTSLPAPWKFDSNVKLVAESQSPFTNVFPLGKQVIQLPNLATAAGFRRPVSLQNEDSQAPSFVNLDFRNVSVDAGGDGYYRIALDHPSNKFSPAVEIFINGSSLAVRDGAELKEIAPLSLGTWYNLQLNVNWPSRLFSGVLSNGKDTWNITDVPFNPTWDGTVDSIVVDTAGTDPAKVRPLREFDNLAIQGTPFLSVSESTDKTQASIKTDLKEFRLALSEATKRKEALASQPPYPTVYGVREGTPANARLQFRGEPERLGDEVPRGFLEILGHQKLSDDCQESGRRQLAEWLTSPSNPLTARVMVNRVWHYYFGRGIVATPNDFGVRGEQPSHPELLDFLATRFREGGYSLKAMHRLILTSRVYQLSSDSNSTANSIDPDNIGMWRHNRRRLDAESLRDTWLALSGELDYSVGEAHPFPPISAWRYSQHNPFDTVYESHRRTVYLMTQRIKRHPFLALFDGADPNAPTGKREITTTPAQALFMMNDEFAHRRSIEFSRRLISDSPIEAEQITRLYEQTYARKPSQSELNMAQSFRKAYSQKMSGDDDRTLSSLAAYVRVILSSNEFLYLD